MTELSFLRRDQALPGRVEATEVAATHVVLGNPMKPPFPAGLAEGIFALGCFWGAERVFWQLPGVWSTAVGYTAGYTPNPTYREVCSGLTGHTEAVRVVFDPLQLTYGQLLQCFWQAHDPTQGMRQGNDVGTQYRSGIYYIDRQQQQLAQQSREAFQRVLTAAGRGAVTTERLPATEFYYAEDYHQQYLAKNPGGYCGLGGTGLACPALE